MSPTIMGLSGAARAALCEAAAILADIDHPDAAEVSDRIATLDRTGAAEDSGV